MARKTATGANTSRPSEPIETAADPIPQSDSPSTLQDEFAELAQIVARAYDEGVTLEEAERLAAKALGVQLAIAERLKVADLDTRMKKNGLKATRARSYMAEATKGEKKPSEGFLENHVNMDVTVQTAANDYESADAETQSLTLYLGIFKDAHIYFRGIAKGRFDG